MKGYKLTGALAAVALLMSTAPVFAQSSEAHGKGQAVVTVLPHGKDATSNLKQQNLSVKVNGKEASVTGVTPYRNENGSLEVVLMMDAGARTSLATQLSDVRDFVSALPQGSKVAIAYMQNGIAKLTGPLTTDHKSVLNNVHVPAGISGEDASPYICLSDLAKHWPSNDRSARREVVMITDGFDYYYPSGDLQDPYMETAIRDSVRAGVVVYSIYWQNKGFINRTAYSNNIGQNLLLQVTEATGGNSYWQGMGNPVSLQPFFKDLLRRFQNQYELSFTAPLQNNHTHVQNLKVSGKDIGGKLDAPNKVYVGRSMGAMSSLQ